MVPGAEPAGAAGALPEGAAGALPEGAAGALPEGLELGAPPVVVVVPAGAAGAF